MEIIELQKRFEKHANVSATVGLLDNNNVISIRNLLGSSTALFAVSLFRKKHIPCLYILNDNESAGYFYNDICQIMQSDDVLFFPSEFKTAAKYGQVDAGNAILRTEVLSRLRDGKQPFIIVSYPDALIEKIVSSDVLQDNTLQLSVSEKVTSAFVSEVLDSYKFEYVDYVYEPGQYASRGSILDVFSYSHELPYRIDFFGDEIETIRTFEIESQLSKERLDSIRLVPKLDRLGDKKASIFDFLPKNTVVGIDDLSWIESRVEFINHDKLAIHPEVDDFVEVEVLPVADFSQILHQFKQLRFDTKTLDKADATLEFKISAQPLFHKNFDLISDSIRKYIDRGYSLYILSDSEKQHKRLQTIFEDRGDNISFIPVDKTIHAGFSDETLKICCFTDHQIFDRFHKYNLKTDQVKSGKIALTLKEIQQLRPGDFVVHMDHGVGRFAGLVRMKTGDKVQEFIKLTYLNNDAVFVSIHSLHKISKYRGKEGTTPSLNKLGSGAWERVKEKTKTKIKDIARDLIKLYATRQQQKGFAFSPDSYMQNELEASFIYEDTPDQLKATAEVKKGMEGEHPMDRLICGDVGFGKTEVAIRAAFKATADNKQTAVLVPTTVLAAQHYRSFSERLSNFPCRVDYISRARPPKEQKQVLLDLEEGKIDILIGTHRIVGKDVKFQDLGLLIIDEEQKFGVSTKEKLKQLKSNVDTLTMTATPIPRTLQFSLMGSRDLSTITTPPPNRHPIQTEVHTFDIDIIKDAVVYELNRNGQVFIVHNRIQNIYEIELLLKRILPHIRVAVAHGQMDPKKLEETISNFIYHEYDVLIATSIIESGIDIPNVNTIIVNNAQNFGLSDLHQLRGRVGRSNKKAFCYLLAPPLCSLSADARRRLQAIENFSDLGSGLHLAMQDLDIRGAGNLLGSEQSGFIADLGYETYQKILAEAMQELRADEFPDLLPASENHTPEEMSFVEEVVFESDLDLMFPVAYIPNDAERISIYRELDNLKGELDTIKFMQCLEDRFGKIPAQGRELIRVVRLRILAKSLGFEKITLKNEKLSLFLISNERSPYYQSPAFDKLLRYVQIYPKICNLREVNRKRSVLIQNVKTVEMACLILEDIRSEK